MFGDCVRAVRLTGDRRWTLCPCCRPAYAYASQPFSALLLLHDIQLRAYWDLCSKSSTIVYIYALLGVLLVSATVDY